MRGTGSLNSRIALKKRVPSASGGRSVDDFEIIGLYAAEVMHLSAKMLASGDAAWNENVVLIHMRTLRTKRLTAGLRVEHLGLGYDVVEVVPDRPKKGFTELRAVAVDMEGCGVMEDAHGEENV